MEIDSIPIIISLSFMAAIVLTSSLLKLFMTITHPNLPRGFMGLPFCGETLGFLKPHDSNSIGTFLQQHCSRYGKVFKSHLFGSPAIVSCDRELNMFVLQNDDKLFKVSYPKAMHGILGLNSLLIASGITHKKLRTVIVSFVNWSKSKLSFLNCMEKMIISLMDSWRSLDQVFFYKEVKMFALDLIVKQLLGIEYGEPVGTTKILEEFETYMNGFVSLPLNLPWTPYAKALKARARLSSMVKEIMKERKTKAIEGIEMEEDDFLNVIMSNWNLNDEEIVSVVLDILLGGYETTATLMGLIVYFVGNSPNVFGKLKEEHQAIRDGKKKGELLNLDDHKQMEFTNNVIYEAMRCGNVVKFLHREALKDIKFKEIFIPSGWKVHPVFTAVHLDPALHENPQQFNPRRWADKEMSKKVTPFGGGPRLCPGIELAKVEIAFFLHHLVLNYRWKTREDECPIAYPYVKFYRDLLLEIELGACGISKN